MGAPVLSRRETVRELARSESSTTTAGGSVLRVVRRVDRRRAEEFRGYSELDWASRESVS